MPQLIVRGIASESLCRVSQQLVKDLAVLCQCGTDNFTIDCLQTVSVESGRPAESYPFIEIGWFDRGREIRDQFARIVTEHVRSLGIPEVEVAFKTYREDSYYINGESCQ